jgi:hypothetical protein
MKHEAFVYKWTNKKNGMIYIGYHKGTDYDGYISSGKRFLEAYHIEPDLFWREIIFRGTKWECLAYEGSSISNVIKEYGYKKLYNKTHWSILKENHVKCMHCDAKCDPSNKEWLENFELWHFDNCSKKAISKSKKLQIKDMFPKKKNKKSKIKNRVCKCPLCI